MKKIIALALAAITLLPTLSAAQEKLEASLSADLVSHYMWRGLDMAGISLQPNASIAWQGLSLAASASTGFEKDDLQDLDITLGYNRWGFNIGVTDYWTKDVDERNRYFYYGGEHECPHQLEANIGYTCKYGSIQAYTMVYGNDYKINGDRAYSTYIELSVPFRAGGLDWDIRAAITPMESAGFSYEELIINEFGREQRVTRGEWLYGESFTCNMASIRATKDLKFKSFRVPVFVELHTNPYLQRANFILGVSIATL